MIRRSFFYALALLSVVGLALVVSDFSEARPQYVKAMADRYPQIKPQLRKAKCQACHLPRRRQTKFSQAFGEGLTEKNSKDQEVLDQAFQHAEQVKTEEGKTFGEILESGAIPE